MNKEDIISVSLSSYTSPKIVETKNKEFVEYGEDNNYFQYLIDRATRSTTNKAILTGISNLIYGKGIDATDAGSKVAEFTTFITKLRPKDARRIITDRKTLGMAAIQVLYKNGEPYKLEHFPMHTLRPEKKNEDGEIEQWFYHPCWKDYKRSDDLEGIKAFGFGNGKEPEIYIWADYVTGSEYFTPPDYIGAVPYALLEEEIADYQINDAQNGFSPTTIVNFNNGIPEDQEKRQELERDVKAKLTGSKGKKVVISFNDDKESQTEVQSIPLNDAPQHYEYLSKECFNKLIVGHRVTSPMLLGIRDGQSGLGNNADEIKNATLLFENIVIRVFQNQFIDIIKEILNPNLDLYFKTIQPLDFMQVEDVSEEEEEKQTGVELSKTEPTDQELYSILEELYGETVDEEEYELVDTREYKEDNESVEDWAKRKIKPLQTTMQKLATAIKSKPSGESNLDKSFYKVRYQYSEKYSSGNSRDFCVKMMRRTDRGVVYRLEDIDKASRQGLNKEFGHKGQAYDLFKYKGGVNCGHFWQENLYRLKKKTDGSFVEDKALSSSTEVDSIPKSYMPRPAGHRKAKVAPKDMPNNGHHPNFKR
jgi:hypothetical protein